MYWKVCLIYFHNLISLSSVNILHSHTFDFHLKGNISCKILKKMDASFWSIKQFEYWKIVCDTKYNVLYILYSTYNLCLLLMCINNQKFCFFMFYKYIVSISRLFKLKDFISYVRKKHYFSFHKPSYKLIL